MQLSTFPITITGWDPVDTMVHNYYGVHFTQDFGVFKNGEEHECICINYYDGIIEAYDVDGINIIKTQKWSYTPTLS